MLSPIKHTLALFFALVGVFTMLSLTTAMPLFDTNTTSGETDYLVSRLEKPYIGVCFVSTCFRLLSCPIPPLKGT